MHRIQTHYKPQKKTKVLGRATTSSNITVNNQLEVFDKFRYLVLTISSKLPLDTWIDKQIGRAATNHARLGTRVWKSRDLLSRPRCQCKTFVFLVHFCMEANRGQHMLLKSVDWMFSICAHWGSYLRYLWRAGHQTQLYCRDVDYQLCSWWFVNVHCASWDMSDEWKKKHFQIYFVWRT